MKMIEPLPELKKKIEDWVKTKISESVAKAKSLNSSEEAVGKSAEWNQLYPDTFLSPWEPTSL